jgi:hypothetical protein
VRVCGQQGARSTKAVASPTRGGIRIYLCRTCLEMLALYCTDIGLPRQDVVVTITASLCADHPTKLRYVYAKCGKTPNAAVVPITSPTVSGDTLGRLVATMPSGLSCVS